MARIAGVTLPAKKRIEAALRYIYGVGWTRAQQILADTKIDPNIRTQNLTEEQITTLQRAVQKFKLEGELRREVIGNIKRLKDIGSWRGMRHAKNLPTRGQRTKTNSRTVRGNVRKTAGSGRSKAAEKT